MNIPDGWFKLETGPVTYGDQCLSPFNTWGYIPDWDVHKKRDATAFTAVIREIGITYTEPTGKPISLF